MHTLSLASPARTRMLAAAVGEGEATVAAMTAGAAVVAALCALALGAAPTLPRWTGALHAGSGLVVVAYIGLLLWLCLLGLAAAAWATGAFDRLHTGRGPQAGLVAGGITLLAIASTVCAQLAFAGGGPAVAALPAAILPLLTIAGLAAAWRRAP